MAKLLVERGTGMRDNKEVVFTLKLERQLRDDFKEATYRAKRSASEVIRELMREYVGRKQQEKDYLKYLRDRIDTARVLVTDGDWVPVDVAARFFASMRGEDVPELDE